MGAMRVIGLRLSFSLALFALLLMVAALRWPV